jgi:hypothetical protein
LFSPFMIGERDKPGVIPAASARFFLARASRLITVPIGIPRTSAASL